MDLHVFCWLQDYASLELRVADDSGMLDDDLPELDNAAKITSVGVPNFVLTPADSDRVLVQLSIPEESIRLHAAERDATSLLVTCHTHVGKPSSLHAFLDSVVTFIAGGKKHTFPLRVTV